MALAPIPPLPPAVRGASFIPVFVSPRVPQSPADVFARVVETARATSGPLPARGLHTAMGEVDIVALLERSLFRDLVSSFQGITGVTSMPQNETSLVTALGVDGLTGRGGLPQSLSGLGDRDAGTLVASISSLLSTIQAFGDQAASAPGVGSLLDISA